MIKKVSSTKSEANFLNSLCQVILESPVEWEKRVRVPHLLLYIQRQEASNKKAERQEVTKCSKI